MITLRNTRRFKSAVKLICYKLDITDDQLDEFIDNGESFDSPVIEDSKKLSASEVASLIESCETKEDLEAYKDDTYQVAKKAYDKKLKSFD